MQRKEENVNNLYEVLNASIENRELFSIIEPYLFNPTENDRYIETCSSNELCIKSKNSNNDIFHLLITPDLDSIENISIKIIFYDGRHEEDTIVQFTEDEGKIVVTKKVVEKIVQGKNLEVVAIRNKTTIKTYIDNQLRYDYEYETETNFKLNNNSAKSTLSETYVDLNGNAVKRVALITNYDFFKDPATITYYETNNYEAPPFNNRRAGGVYKIGMSVTTKEVFDDFISSQNNKLVLK